MVAETPQEGTNITFGFLLVPGFSLVALAAAIDALRAANLEQTKVLYQWQMLGETEGVILSSSGIPIPNQHFSVGRDADVIAVCGGERSHLFHSPSVENWLKAQARSDKRIGSLSDGAYVLANAGLFENARSTIHWKCQSAYRERFPRLDVRTSIIEVDGNRFSCAGGTSSLDLMLRLISSDVGPTVIGKIADNYFHDVIRGDDQVQHMTSAFRFAGRDKTFSDALLLMESNLEQPLSLKDLAKQCGISERQLDRIFNRHIGTSPSQHYRELRLIRASGLLKQTSFSVAEIAISCGFQSASHLSKFFKRKFGETPLQHRRHQ